jgi:hypothetical protein
VETGIVDTGSGDPVVMGAVASLVGFGDPVVMDDGGLLMGFADSDDAGVGGLSVTVADETPVGDSGLLVEVADESVVGVGGIDWATGSWFFDGALVVSTCWLHPLRNKPTSVLATAIWIFCNDFMFMIPLFKRAF